MIRIAFFPPVGRGWMGGANYYKNLFHAISAHDADAKLSITSFVGKKTPPDLIQECYSNSNIIRSSIFDRWSPLWLLSKLFSKIVKYDPLLHFVLLRNRIDVVSHSTPLVPDSIIKLGWIPDFQHVYLPNFFSDEELRNRDKDFKSIASNSEIVFLSSCDALSHYKLFFPPELHQKARVLRFVSQIDPLYFDFDEKNLTDVVSRYKIKENFFFIPNQFWAHKNHKVVLEAANKLKNECVDFCFVFTGNKHDYRNPKLFNDLIDFVESNDLTENIFFLGSVPYIDVMALIRFSTAVINPSLFEGWSSTVEECKSAGKEMILSDIPVHREQYPDAVFFNPNNPAELADVIKQNIVNKNLFKSDQISICNENRTKEYFCSYMTVIDSLRNIGK